MEKNRYIINDKHSTEVGPCESMNQGIGYFPVYYELWYIGIGSYIIMFDKDAHRRLFFFISDVVDN